MALKWKWTVGILGTIVLGALGSGLWSVLFAPLGSFLVKFTLSLVTLGISSARDHVYASAASGYTERPSVMLLCFFGATVFMVPFGLIAFYVATRRALRIRGSMRAEYQSREKRGKYVFRILLPTEVLLGSVLFVQILLVGYTNTIISRFHQALAIAKPHLSQQEYDQFVARFAKVKTRQDFLAVFAGIDDVLVANGETKSDFSPW